MKRKKDKVSGSGGPNWIDTYADMVTLLLTFFVLMFSISTVNAEKWSIIVRSFAGESTNQQQIVINTPELDSEPADGLIDSHQDGEAISDQDIPESVDEIQTFDDLYLYFKKYVEDNNLESDVEINRGDGFTFITFRNNIFFDGDSAYLKSNGKQVLDVLSNAFLNIQDQISAVKFEGHTARAGAADDPNASIFDWQLSSERAVNVLYYIYSKDVIDPAKLTATGHGEHKPIVPHDGTEESRIKNRRVEIYIGKAGEKDLSLDEVYEQLYGIDSGENTGNSN